MRLNEIEYNDALPVQGYGPGFFRIAGKVHEGGLLMLPAGVSHWGGFDDTAALLAAADSIDVLFVGTGADIAHLPGEFLAALDAAGIAPETTASAPACRTYNILLSEGRRVGLAALPV